MILALTLTGVNLFIAFLLYRRARRLKQESEALAYYKASVSKKVNETMHSFDRSARMHERQIEVMEAKICEQERTIDQLMKTDPRRVFVIHGCQHSKYHLN